MPRIIKEFIIKNAQGLHARPAAMFVQIANKYNANVIVQKGDERINGKSIMGILTLGAQQNSRLTIEVDGEGAEAMLEEFDRLLNQSEIK